MPPRAAKLSTLAGLIGSDSEPELDSILATAASAMDGAKRPRGRPPAASKATKPAPRRLSSGVAKSTQPLRRVLKDKSNAKSATEDEDSGKDMKSGRGRPPKQRINATAASLSSSSRMAANVPKRGRPPSKSSKSANAETVEEGGGLAMEVDAGETLEEAAIPEHTLGEEGEEEQEMTEVVQDYDANDSTLRRRLGELTRRYDSLESKHRQLQEIGIKEAERNYDRLRRQGDENMSASNKLIAGLKDELGAQKALAQRGNQLRGQLTKSENEIGKLQDSVEQLTKSLEEARSEIKTLSTKLAASRNNEAQATAKVPGSALKANAPAARAAAAQQTEAMQAAQLKEDLYGDLTGLIIRSLKRGRDGDVFDCIQTGRNGTLHFKLALEKADDAENYQDLEFTYRPQLDESRDAEMMEMLPEYLTDEITFPRPQAAKFYNRISKSLTGT